MRSKASNSVRRDILRGEDVTFNLRTASVTSN